MEKCIFIGYPDGYKSWKFYNSKTKKVIISERADFDEWYTYGTISESGDIRESTYIQEYTPGSAIENNGDEQEPVTPAAPSVVEKQPAPVDEEPAPVQVPEQPIRPRTRQCARIEPAQDDEDDEDNRPIAIRKSIQKAASARPVKWWKVHETTPVIESSDEDEEDNEDEEAANHIGESDPATWKEAMSGPHAEQWKEAALKEMNVHHSNGTWDLVELPSGEKAIGSKWVFQIKRNANSSKHALLPKGLAKDLDLITWKPMHLHCVQLLFG